MAISPQSLPRLIPTGTCWCGCGAETGLGAFFARGHDKTAEGALLASIYGGSVAQLLHGHGFGPGHSVTDVAVEGGAWTRCSADGCNYAGTSESLRNHQIKSGHGRGKLADALAHLQSVRRPITVSSLAKAINIHLTTALDYLHQLKGQGAAQIDSKNGNESLWALADDLVDLEVRTKSSRGADRRAATVNKS